jgi:capsular polysaccharide export protein
MTAAVEGEGLLRAMPCGDGSAVRVSVMSDPEPLLNDRGWESFELLARAAAARQALVAAQAGGDWWLGDNAGVQHGEPHVLVALDREDGAGAPAMLATAAAENPGAHIVKVATGSCDPWAALSGAARVYTLGGETGFLALLADRPVHCFGDAFYAGWGATIDGPAVARRALSRSVDEIFAGACLLATRCIDPFRGTPCSFEDALAIVADWRRLDRINRTIAVCVGMSFWKRRRVAEFLRSGAGVPLFRRSVAGAVAVARRRNGAIAGWSSRMPLGMEAAANAQDVPLIRVEDGFVRSVGLGSDFLPPASLVLDSQGMYFDPRTPSNLERLLCETAFGPALIERASRLADQLVQRGVTKYNLAAGARPIAWPSGRARIVVPGQVEDDLSVVLGGGDIRGNLDLLARVRTARPDAFIVYKPHPDVLAGHRKGAVPEAAARQFADAVVTDAATAALLGEIDELHTLTSLAGFEALLRRRHVVVYGQPWYAGWGLTDDAVVIDRRRRLTLEELVAGALILYPRYLDPATRLPCGPEIIIERLDQPELWQAGPLVQTRRLQGAAVRWWTRRAVRAPAMAAARQKGRG